MRHHVLTHAFIWLFGLTFLTATLAISATAAVVVRPEGYRMEITLTNQGISPQFVEPGRPGLYYVTIKNDSNEPRGIVMRGIDKGPSPYVRYTKVLRPGQQSVFRWYFPANRTVSVRDLLSCFHSQRTCMAATFGRHQSVLEFTG